MFDRAENGTPFPYQDGNTLQLEILQDFCTTHLTRTVSVVINKSIAMTMSCALDVTVKGESGQEFRAVLKLYDRRFPAELRELDEGGIPHTPETEAAFHSFALDDKFHSLRRDMRQFVIEVGLDPTPIAFLEDPLDPNQVGRYEAAMWLNCQDYFESETDRKSVV